MLHIHVPFIDFTLLVIALVQAVFLLLPLGSMILETYFQIFLLILMRSSSLGSSCIFGRVGIGESLFIASTLGICLGAIVGIFLGGFIVG